MKRNLLILICLLGLYSPAFAYITTGELSSPEYIINHGHSTEIARLIDLQNSHITGAPTRYRSNDPAFYETNPVIKFVRKVFIYLDPGLDNGKFGANEIEFSNSYKEEL